MGLDFHYHVVGPRLIALLIGTPICVMAADIAGLYGSFLAGAYQLGLDAGTFWNFMLWPISNKDLIGGIYKGIIFGVMIGNIALFEGLQVHSGAYAVGEATNKAIVRSMITGALTSLAISYTFYGGLLR